MDYDSWLRCEAVPLSNGVLTRRSGLNYMKSPEEIHAYYLRQFGTYWFNELPKTDNVYSPTSKYYGCTLAPGIPLIPNLCRRPLRSPGSDEYEYSFTSTFLPTQPFSKQRAFGFTEENHSNHINSLIEDKNNHSSNLGNGNNHNHFLGMTKLPRRRISFHDSGVDSDSDLDDGGHVQYSSQNTVTWISWIITTVTTIITTITETITGGRQNHHNHINTRVPLKQDEGLSWYQYPVFWLYNLALLVHRADIWLLSKVNSYLQVDSWGPPDKRRRWALILLLIPLILWAGYKFLEWLWGEDFLGENLSLAWIATQPLVWIVAAWDATLACLSNIWAWFDGSYFSDAWGWFDGSYFSTAVGWFDGSYFSAAWGWFDGSWFWAPWLFVTGMFERASETVATVDSGVTDEASETLSEVDLSGFVSWVTRPYYSIMALLVSVGELLSTSASALGEGSVTVLSSVGTLLADVFAWIVGCVTSVPALLSSVLALVAYPFQSMKWEASKVDYAAPVPIPADTYYSPSPAPSDSVSIDQLLRDKQLLALLARSLLSSEEFERAMAARHSSSQEQVNSAVNTAITEALTKFNLEFNKVRNDLSDNISVEKSSVEAKMESLKQQIHTLQEALIAHKTLVQEQAVVGNKLENWKLHEEIEIEKLKNQISLEVADLRKEMQLLNIQQSHQNVVVESDSSLNLANPSELEGLINSTVERLLAIYDADKIAKVDYALASSGGSVLSVRCTETYNKKNAQYYVMGYPLWSKSSNDPRIALEPAINPGECWAFTGSRGYMVIELSENITVTAFTLEHLPRSLSPSGTIDTAPMDFHVLGLESEEDDTPILLGKFRYEDNGMSLQHFLALEVEHSFKLVELVVESNHGNLEYTCLYRFRVHGRPARLT